jgi:hypothetical protein
MRDDGSARGRWAVSGLGQAKSMVKGVVKHPIGVKPGSTEYKPIYCSPVMSELLFKRRTMGHECA